jgi:FKBP-type peptidyl-prolyl cis-trans isomerase
MLAALMVVSFGAIAPAQDGGASAVAPNAAPVASNATVVESLPDAAATLTPRYALNTTKGRIVIELDAAKAPNSALNFDQYVREGFYSGTIFHRVIQGFMIQGGGFGTDQVQKQNLRPGVKNEWRNGLKNSRGTVAMARIGRRPDSGTAQFFINVVDNPALDQPNDGAGYAVFGRVVEGMDVADAIAAAPVASNPKLGRDRSAPVENIVIDSVDVVAPLDLVKANELAPRILEDFAAAEARAAEEKLKAAAQEVETFLATKETELGAKRETTASGLTSIVMKPGTGTRKPAGSDSVKVHYVGTFLDGKEFDSSVRRGEPFEVNVAGGVIDGWLEGLKLMTEGEKRLFVIPPALAYGEAGAPGAIPPNSTLVFEIELLEFK